MRFGFSQPGSAGFQLPFAGLPPFPPPFPFSTSPRFFWMSFLGVKALHSVCFCDCSGPTAPSAATRGIPGAKRWGAEGDGGLGAGERGGTDPLSAQYLHSPRRCCPSDATISFYCCPIHDGSQVCADAIVPVIDASASKRKVLSFIRDDKGL